nr:MAG TPA: hypothetical protein [Bacteriophage sp.]
MKSGEKDILQNLKMGKYLHGQMEQLLFLRITQILQNSGIKENLRRKPYECQKAVYRKRVHWKDILQSERMGS